MSMEQPYWHYAKELFQMAEGGVLYIDEAGPLPYKLQRDLLDFLEQMKLHNKGMNIRYIGSSRDSIEKTADKNIFYKEMFCNKNVIKIKIPSLQQRKEDIPLIVEKMAETLNFQMGTYVTKISEEVINRLQEYPWQGNIRQLYRAVEQAMGRACGGVLRWEDFQEYFETEQLKKYHISPQNKNYHIKDMKKNLEREIIFEALEKNKFNKTRTAEFLGISRTLLYRKIKDYNL